MRPKNFRHWYMMLYYPSPCLSIGWPHLHNGISPSVCMSASFMCTFTLAITSVTKLQIPLKFNDFNFQGFKCPGLPSHWWRMNDLYVWNGDRPTIHIGVKNTCKTPRHLNRIWDASLKHHLCHQRIPACQLAHQPFSLPSTLVLLVQKHMKPGSQHFSGINS